MAYTIYNDTGRILWVSYPSDKYKDPSTIAPGFNYLEGEGDGDTHYVKDGKFVERPDMELKVSKNEIKADGEDSVTISNIPTGCEVFCSKLPEDQQLFTVDDGEITFQTELKGSYIFQFKLFPYKECEVVINAN